VVWGPATLGIYSKAHSLIHIPVDYVKIPVSRVIWPVLCRVQNRPERFRRYYRKALEMVLVPSVSAVALCLIFAPEIVRVLLGSQWDAAVPVFRALSPAALLTVLNAASQWVLVPLGLGRRRLNLTLWLTPVRVAGMCVGLPYGPVGVALGYSAAECLVKPFQMRHVFAGTFLRIGDVLHAVWRPLLACVPALLAVGLVRLVYRPDAAALTLAAHGAVFIGCYGIAWFSAPGGQRLGREMFRAFKGGNPLEGDKDRNPGGADG
jgi:PST family polysaccharide transporter